jgi:hypothetical protein
VKKKKVKLEAVINEDEERKEASRLSEIMEYFNKK